MGAKEEFIYQKDYWNSNGYQALAPDQSPRSSLDSLRSHRSLPASYLCIILYPLSLLLIRFGSILPTQVYQGWE